MAHFEQPQNTLSYSLKHNYGQYKEQAIYIFNFALLVLNVEIAAWFERKTFRNSFKTKVFIQIIVLIIYPKKYANNPFSGELINFNHLKNSF